MAGDWFWFAIVCSPLFLFVHKKLRIKLPIIVNCWFCNKNTIVTFGSRNSWMCPYCEQYNGFDKDGGYNKIIEEQHVSHLNKKPLQDASKLSLKELNRSNGLCKLCNLNQELKIQQLARFIPTEEGNFDKEIKEYREQLEKSYQLCNRCDEILKDTLEKQRADLFTEQFAFEPSKFSGIDDVCPPSNIKRFALSSLKIFSAFVVLWIACALLWKRTAQAQVKILDFFLSEGLLADVQVPLIFESDKFCKELTGIGFLSYLLSTYNHRSDADVINLVLWSGFHVSTWTGFVDLQVLISLVLFVSVCRAMHADRRRVVPKKPGGKKSLTGSEGPAKSAYREPSVIERKEKMETKSSYEETGLELDSKIAGFGGLEFKQVQANSFLEKACFDKLKDDSHGGNLAEAPDEIYSDMTHLNLGTKRGKVVKPANFLFQSHNFKTKSADVFPLLKPPKLFTPDQSFSGNSIPSVSSSVIKPERFEPKDCYDFTPAAYPVTTTPFHHVNFNTFPCFEGNHFYNDFNYQDQDFIPSSNRLSNVPQSMYSYPMRENFPFSYKCMPDYQCSLNKREQALTRKYLFDIRWDRIKSFFYATSIFLNVVTLFFLGYHAWSGFILLELRLPSFNFFV